jgi:hypothetical protein
VNIGMILKGYGTVDVCNFVWMTSQLIFVARSKSLCLECSFQPHLSANVWWYSSQAASSPCNFKGHLKFLQFLQKKLPHLLKAVSWEHNDICNCDMMNYLPISGMP